jgi:hypothetical protein
MARFCVARDRLWDHPGVAVDTLARRPTPNQLMLWDGIKAWLEPDRQ